MPETLSHPLTDRELDVLLLTSRGFRADDIGRKLGITPATVKTHKSNITRKTGLPITGSVALAIRKGWIS